MNYSKCPICKSDCIDCYDIQNGFDGIENHKMSCEECGATWIAVYDLIGLKDIKKHEDIIS